MKIQQIRGATVVVTYADKRFLMDPFLADKGTLPPIASPYNDDWNPLVDLPPVPISEIVAVDAIIVTHMHHFDHFDLPPREDLPKDIPVFTQDAEEAQEMRDLGFQNVSPLLDEGLSFGDITLYRTDGEHGRGEAAIANYEALGIPYKVCGVVFTGSGEKTLYIAGDTLWGVPVKEAIDKYEPDVIVLNAARAEFADGTPILMGLNGLYEVSKAAPAATLVASHLDTVNHARLTRVDLRDFVQEKGLASRVLIPEDGEELSL